MMILPISVYTNNSNHNGHCGGHHNALALVLTQVKKNILTTITLQSVLIHGEREGD